MPSSVDWLPPSGKKNNVLLSKRFDKDAAAQATHRLPHRHQSTISSGPANRGLRLRAPPFLLLSLLHLRHSSRPLPSPHRAIETHGLRVRSASWRPPPRPLQPPPSRLLSAHDTLPGIPSPPPPPPTPHLVSLLRPPLLGLVVVVLPPLPVLGTLLNHPRRRAWQPWRRLSAVPSARSLGERSSLLRTGVHPRASSRLSSIDVGELSERLGRKASGCGW